MKIIAYDQFLVPIVENGTEKQIQINSEWVFGNIKIDKSAIEFAQYFARFLLDPKQVSIGKWIPGQNGLSTTQLRRFFSHMKRCQAQGFEKSKNDIRMLLPLLAYAAGRAKKDSNSKDNRILKFYEVNRYLIPQINEEYQFQNYVNFIEAIVAYHKFQTPQIEVK